MGSYDWMELQSLTAEIATSRSRLVAARKTRDVGRVNALQEEISAAEARRERLLAHITTNLVSAPEPPPPTAKGAVAPAEAEAAPPTEAANNTAPAMAKGAAVAEEPAPVEAEADPAPIEADPEPAATETEPEPTPATSVATEPPTIPEPPPPIEMSEAEVPADRTVTPPAPPPGAARRADRAEGSFDVWDQLTPSDLDRAKRDLDSRRAEMLTRHAEELQALEVDRAQLDGLEQAISMFMQKFTGQPGAAGVVKLGAERELRQQGAG
jgi:hypothetical protein